MKGAIVVLTVVMLMPVIDANDYGPCLVGCSTTHTTCTLNTAVCHDFDSCNHNCYNAYESCANACKRKRELLSRFSLEDDDLDTFFR